jgi:hypothetical protein
VIPSGDIEFSATVVERNIVNTLFLIDHSPYIVSNIVDKSNKFESLSILEIILLS